MIPIKSERRYSVKGKYRPVDADVIHNGGMKEVGHRIRMLRKARGLTQPQLAKAIGCAQSTISELETGESRKPQSGNLLKLAKFFDVDIEHLLSGKGDPRTVSSMSDDESELLILYRSLSPSGRGYVLGRARDVHQDEHRGDGDSPPHQDPPAHPTKPKRLN